MPEIKPLENGKFEVIYETGEKFTGDQMEVMNEMGKAHESTKRWAQNIKAENENLKNQQLNPPAPPPPAQPAAEIELQRYITNLAFGASPEEVAAWRKEQNEIARMTREMREERDTENIAMSFQHEFPEFPGDEKANAALVSILQQKEGPVTYNDVVAAHTLAMRRGMYKPLNTDEVNMAANQSAAQQQGRPIPPQPPQGGNPDGSQLNGNPWQQSTDELRKQLLSQGGLGKALLDLKPGETFGG